MQSSKELQGEIGKPSSVISAKKLRMGMGNRMGKTRYLFKKIRDTKGTFHAKKRWQEYTELYKKDLHDPDNHDGVIDHSTKARHTGMQSQASLRKHHHEQN